ncbi:STAS domain-containing protein [Actinorugispora endophytica]|uniref:Anti-anti-sigma factor n=1 Tax=Actinorugispora endophytica TaxID=1605990 RepID=A0A4R6VBW6_9ACTN|nr:STAS domain-containing protein [Actinorugispora endophytica]TDQ54216.1 anti-anti-sigma factor [Actinorugispora endophytica]
MKQQTQIIAKVDYIGCGAVVTLPQSVEERHGYALREQMLWLLNERIDELVIDLRRVIFCDSSAAEVVERVRSRTQAMGIRLSLVVTPDSPAERVLRESGLTRLLAVHPTRAHAEQALAEAANAARGCAGGGIPAQRRRGGTLLSS